RRSMPLTVLETFDNPSTSPNCERRSFSTGAPQSLLLMNSQFMTDSAAAFAERLRREAPDERSRIALAWRIVYAREPGAAEAADALAYVAEQTAHYGAMKRAKTDPEPGQQALATFCQALLCSNAFLYVD